MGRSAPISTFRTVLATNLRFGYIITLCAPYFNLRLRQLHLARAEAPSVLLWFDEALQQRAHLKPIWH